MQLNTDVFCRVRFVIDREISIIKRTQQSQRKEK